MKPTTIFAALLFSSALFSQSPTFDWAKQMGGTNPARGQAISIDGSNNSYTSGAFAGTTDFDPGPGTYPLTSYSGTQSNAFISKLNPLGDFVWAKAFISTNASAINSTEIDDLGNIYLTGLFIGTCDFDPSSSSSFNLTSTGTASNAFVCKLNASGDFVWAKITGTEFTLADEIDIDFQGNVITVGQFSGIVDFDPGPGLFPMSTSAASSERDIFISKLDSNGNFIWAKQMGGTGNDGGNGVSTDSDGNIYITGSFSDTADFDPNVGVYNLIATGIIDAFVSKLDSSGNFIWAVRMGGSVGCVGSSILTSSSGKLYVSGKFDGIVDFDPGVGVAERISNGAFDIFVMELDTTGNFGWVNSIGGTFNDAAHSVQLDNNENVYIHGEFRDTVDFDPGSGTFNLNSTSTSITYICKLTNTGAFVWAVRVGGRAIPVGPAMAIDAFDNVYATGYFIATADFDPGIGVFNMTPSTFDCYILKLNQCSPTSPTISISSSEGDTICNGTNVTFTGSVNNGGPTSIYQWKKNGINVGTNSATYSNASLISGDVIICELTSTDPCGLISIDTSNVITMSVNQPTSGTDTQTACEAFTWIDGNTYTSSNNTATYTVINSQGCDSLVTLDLTFVPLDLSVTNSDPTLTANATGVSYQWVDCDNFFVPISGETTSSFTATSNGSYAVIISSNGCSDTSICSVISTIGIDEFATHLFSVYPNPTSGKLSIDFPSRNGNVRLRIANVLGQVVVNRTFRLEEELTLIIDSESGFYVLEIETEEGEILKSTFVKNK